MHPHTVPDWVTELNRTGKAGQPCFFLLDFELRKPQVFTGDLGASRGVRFSFPGRRDPFWSTSRQPEMRPDYLPFSAFEPPFQIVQQGLQRGDSFLTNLTFATPVALLADGLEDVYRATRAKYRVLLPHHFVCFSPETFVTVDDHNQLETRPMKGTAPNTEEGIDHLLSNPKEVAEHATIVDLMRNDLSRVASNVRVTDYRYVEPIESAAGGLVQTSSRIGGDLPVDWPDRLGSLLYELLPAGSVSGAPKPATLDLIRRAEGTDRGYYCGIAGYFDGRTLDSCVLIRYLEQVDDRYLFRSGGGITARSSAREEYEEVKAKIRLPLRKPR
ncbi:aminodeoxychorismate synthase component I [Neolewinella xylanilytica]|uniref:aminodeoxychorismate synthase component I n=1 Tax=Neolewinella xylanilytica TaxID=1514080 RepID=UPI001FE7CDCD|nr:aminodeoxychorismate synthase component I [Neolewinella xylanilytica]